MLAVAVACGGGPSPTETGEPEGPTGSTLTWTGLADDSTWSAAGNWSADRVPGPMDSVAFTEADTVVLTVDVEIARLAVPAGQDVRLLFNDAVMAAGGVDVAASGRLVAVGPGTLDLSEGALSVAGAFVAGSGIVLDAPPLHSNTGELAVVSGATWNGTTLTNASTGKLVLGGNSTIAANLRNEGTAMVLSQAAFLTGNLDAVQPITGTLSTSTGFASGILRMTGDGVTLEGTTGDLTIAGTVSLTGTTETVGDLIIEGVGSELSVNGHALTAWALETRDGGHLRMTDPADDVTVGDQALFDSGATDGLFTAGTLRVARKLYVIADSYVASDAHVTVLTGGLGNWIFFDAPDQSELATLQIDADVTTVVPYSDLYVRGLVSVASSNATIGYGNAMRLRAGGIDMNGGTFKHVLLDIVATTPGATISLDNTTFVAYDADDTQLSITHPGGAAYSLTGLTFDPLLDGDAGYYVSATDDAANGALLTLEVGNDPGNGAVRTDVNGADLPTVTWP